MGCHESLGRSCQHQVQELWDNLGKEGSFLLEENTYCGFCSAWFSELQHIDVGDQQILVCPCQWRYWRVLMAHSWPCSWEGQTSFLSSGVLNTCGQLAGCTSSETQLPPASPGAVTRLPSLLQMVYGGR